MKLRLAQYAVCTCVLLRAAALAGCGGRTVVQSLPATPWPQHRSDQIDYSIDPTREQFLVYEPAGYNGTQPFGLVVYISPLNSVSQLPDGWASVLDKRRLLFIAPQAAGNETFQKRRQGLAVMGAVAAMRQYKIDPARVYAAGLSGGARTASDLGFHQSDLFKGTIQSCGSDFYRQVPARYATSKTDTGGNPYGVVPGVTESEVNQARANVKFALITGASDFRHGNILDLYYGGFAAEKFRAKLFDYPNMGHQDCDGAAFEAALDFVESKN